MSTEDVISFTHAYIFSFLLEAKKKLQFIQRGLNLLNACFKLATVEQATETILFSSVSYCRNIFSNFISRKFHVWKRLLADQ